MAKYSKKQERDDLITAIKGAMNCKCEAKDGVNGVVGPVESIRQQIIKIYEYRNNKKLSSKLVKSMDNELGNFVKNQEIKNVDDVKKFLEGLTKIKGGIGTVWDNKVKKGIEEGVKTKLKMENNKQKQLNHLKSFIEEHNNIEHKEFKKHLEKLKSIKEEFEKNYNNINQIIPLSDKLIEIYEEMDKIAKEVKPNEKATKKEMNTINKEEDKLLRETEKNIRTTKTNLIKIKKNNSIS